MQKLNTVHKLLLILIIFIGIFLRFYNLNWGAPFYFHPDERNIASSITQLSFPGQMNPNFFAYGSLPIYVIYFTGILMNIVSNILNHLNQTIITKVSFEDAILISRFYSALLSVLLLILVYRTSKLIRNNLSADLTILIGVFSVGFIQFSHFGTFEMWLTFFSFLMFFSLVNFIKTKRNSYLMLSFIVYGILLAIKLSSLALFPVLILGMYLENKSNINSKKEFSNFLLKFLKSNVLKVVLLSIISLSTALILSPYTLLDYKSFQSSINYESSVALGTLPVFYTGGFFDTIPIIYHFRYVFPFLINPALTILFIPSFIYVLYTLTKTKNYYYVLLISFFLIIFLSQAFFFVKWIRYMVPVLPFIYLITSFALVDFLKNIKFRYLFFVLIISISFTYSLSYFITMYSNDDSRISASLWAKTHIYGNKRILSEVYDMGIVPFNQYFSNIKLFNFYDLDNGPFGVNKLELSYAARESDYIILPSQRIMRNRLLQPEKFSNGYGFYKNLFSGSLEYKKIYETPCDIFCKITYLGNPIFNVEETANVFDRPTVFIFEKTQNLRLNNESGINGNKP